MAVVPLRFLEMPNGRLINADAIKTFDPNRSNRLDYADGTHELLSAEDAEALKNALKPRAPEPAPKAETATSRTRKTK